MKYTGFVLAAAGSVSALIQQCSTGSPVDEGGNWFCGAVDHILYQGITGKGSYKAVTSMTDGGECQTEDRAYGGPLAPLDEGLSIHIRGPIQVKEVAVYNLATKKRDNHGHNHAAFHHGHQHLHEERKAKRGEWVTATINGQVVSWENNWFGPATNVPAAPAATSPPVAEAPKPKIKADIGNKAHAEPKSKGNSKAPPAHSSGSDWSRVSYYGAEEQVSDNIVFLGNYGGQGSGVWDSTWGSSLAYLNADGSGGSGSPQTLKDIYIPSNKEFAIFSGEKCDASCGYARAPDVAYRGFSGGNKVFVFRFKMPLDGNRGFNGDMPALWLLNSQIPRSAQYDFCSCWPTGCGECDIYEVLASGDTKCKSTFHLANGAGSSDYFDRPVDDFINVAVVFHEDSASVSIKKISDDFDFSEGLEDDTVRSWISSEADPKLSSLFQLLG